MGMVACGSKSGSKGGRMDEIAQEANKSCPISVGMVGEIESIEFDGTDIVCMVSTNEDLVDIALMEQNKDLAKQGALQMLTGNANNNVEEMIKELENANAGMKFVYKGKTSGKVFSIRLTPDDIKQAKANPVEPEEFLNQQLGIVNSQCPMTVVEGKVMTKVFDDSENVVYLYDVDEEILDMDAMEANRDEIQASLDQYLDYMDNDPAGGAFLMACRNAGRNISYCYRGTSTGKTVTFICTL